MVDVCGSLSESSSIMRRSKSSTPSASLYFHSRQYLTVLPVIILRMGMLCWQRCDTLVGIADNTGRVA